MTCSDMLAANFAHVKKVSIKTGDFLTVHVVYVTVTIHESSDSSDRTRDNVFYANGELKLQSKMNVEVLSGEIRMWVNRDVQNVPDIFPYNEQLKLKVMVSSTGDVVVQRLVENKAFLGRPPVKFKSVCTQGLLTGIVDNGSYTLSFTNGKDIIG